MARSPPRFRRRRLSGTPSPSSKGSPCSRVTSTAPMSGWPRFGPDHVYLDLGNEAWEAVEIDRRGWRVVTDPPVRFIRAPGHAAAAPPGRGAARSTSCASSSTSRRRLAAGRRVRRRDAQPPRPLPGAERHRRTGHRQDVVVPVSSAASSTRTPLDRGRPRNEHDLAISAEQSWVLSFDNLGSIAGVAVGCLLPAVDRGRVRGTGALHRRRGTAFQRHAPDHPQRHRRRRHPRRPARPVASSCPPEPSPRSARKLTWRAVRGAWPQLLGACLDAAATALTDRHETRELDLLPRLADFTQWVVAAEPALGLDAGDFLAAYEENRQRRTGSSSTPRHPGLRS